MSLQPARSAVQKSAAAPAPAVLVLDAEGRIQAASAGACALWQAKPHELAGDHFPNLFQFEVTSKDPGWTQSQWEVLLAAGLDAPLRLQLAPKETAAFDAEVRIERVLDDPACFFAYASRVVPPTVVSAPPPGDTAQTLVNVLNERSPLGFFDLNFTAGTVYYAPAWKKMLGYEPDELPDTYDTWLKLLHPDDSSAAPDRRARGSATGPRSFSLEFRMQHARGHFVWVHCAGVQLYGPNGALQRVVGAQLDIQDRKEFEEAGLRADERQQHLGDEGRLGFFDLDFAAGTFWYSPAFLRLVGCPESDATGSADVFAAALPPGAAPDGLAAWFTAQSPREPAFSTGLTLRDGAGREFAVQLGVVRLYGKRKDLQRAIGYVAPAAAGAAAGTGLPHDHLAVLLQDMREGTLFADANGHTLLANPQALKLLGRTSEQVIGQHVGEVFRIVHRLSRQPGENPTDRVLTTGEPLPLNDEFALDTGDGRVAPVTYSCHPVGRAGAAPVGAVLVFRNPDEMSLTPEELIRANRFDSLGQLAGGIAHDFNNLLTAILGYSDLLLMRVERSSPLREDVEEVRKAGKRAAALVQQLL
ncbi:MAG TPA: PAS domain-containing protein, partial [Opitutaceae bacterium]|nr:PAS domain-containing protein [Opitutaceae bacterium]